MIPKRRKYSGEERRERPAGTSGQHKITAVDHPDIWDMYARGWKQVDIAKHYGVTPGRITQIITQLSVTMPQVSREEMLATFLAGCRELYESAMDDVRNAPIAHRSAARRDAQMVLDRLAQIAALTKRPIVPTGDLDIRYVIEGDEDMLRALT